MRKSTINPAIRQHAKELRQNQTPMEAKLWHALRNRQVANLKFRRQAPLGSYIADFYCAEARLVVEIDGDSHASQESYDLTRTAWLIEQGYQVIRFTNLDVNQQFDAVISHIILACQADISAAAQAF